MKTVSIHSKELLSLIIEAIDVGSSFKLKVKGQSMYPFLLHDKSYVVLSKPDNIKRNSIYLFVYNDNVILHSLRKIKKEEYFFIGDAQYRYEIVKKQDVIAKVIAIKTDKKRINPNSKWNCLKVNLWYSIKKAKKIARRIIKR